MYGKKSQLEDNIKTFLPKCQKMILVTLIIDHLSYLPSLSESYLRYSLRDIVKIILGIGDYTLLLQYADC
jgi:hypothetical protein